MNVAQSNTTPSPRLRHVALLSAVVAAMSLAACGREDSTETAGERVDDTVATAEQKTEAAGDRIGEGAAEVKEDISNATADARDAVADAAITAAVNAKFATDDDLSAFKIDVDTVDGKVALRGEAPSKEAMERAGQLALTVDGVTGVLNELIIKTS